MAISTQDCPVCRAPGSRPFAELEGRRYWRCDRCEATFLQRDQRPTREQERRHYLTHQNDVDDAGYRAFLAKLADPLSARLEPGQRGLDYGCGPGPALAAMLREAGHRMVLYDPLFRPDGAALEATYDFITCTETAEHFHHPADELDRLCRLLRPGGILAFLTCFQTDDARFEGWHYRRDPTHVVFYRAHTMRRLARDRGFPCEIPRKDVALMRKPEGEGAPRGG